MSGIVSAFHTARTGLQFQELHLAIKAHNIAAQGADGYKKEYLLGMTLSYQDNGNVGVPTSDSGSIAPTGLQIGLGVQPAGIYRMFTQGDPIHTDSPLDLMIDGDGFFLVTLPDGSTGYTRVGALQRSGNNMLVMPKTGYPIVPNITLPSDSTSVSINPGGQVYVLMPGNAVPQLVGQIEMATFFNPSGLRAIEDSLFTETQASGSPDKGVPGTNRRGYTKQGWREGSNVNPVEEMTDLIKIEKIYDMLTKVIKTGDSMMESTTHIRA